MATRFLGVVTSEVLNTQYTVWLMDSEYASTPTLCTLENVIINYDGQGNERNQAIIGASCNVGLVIDSTDIETFLDDITGSAEGRFTVAIIEGLDFSSVKFMGYVLPDLITRPDRHEKENPVMQLKATDGLSRLKAIDYNNSGSPYSGYETILAHIFNCLNKLTAITSAYNSSQAFLKMIFNWYEDSRTYSATENMLTKTRNNHVAYYEIDSKGNYNYKTCYEVLTEICEAFGMQIFFSDGTFWIRQIGELAVGAINNKRVFTYSKTQSESVSNIELRISNYQADLDEEICKLSRLIGGQWSHFAPLRKSIVRYAHRSSVNILAGKTFVDDSPAVTYETIDSYGGTAKLSFTGTLRITIDGGIVSTFPCFAVFEFTIKIGANQYLQRFVSFSGGGYNIGVATWSASSTVFEIVEGIGLADYELTFPISFLTPEIPASGDLEFDINFGGLFDTNGDAISFAQIATSWTFENLYLELLGIGAFSGQADITEYSSSNDTTTNSQTLEVDTILGDGPGLTSPGHLMVQKDNTVWEISDAWRVGDSGIYDNISQLLANELIKGQLTPVKKFTGTFRYEREQYEAWKIIDIYGEYFVFNGGAFDLKRDRVTGEWYKIQSATDYTENTPIERPSGAGGGSGTPSATIPTNPGGGGSSTQFRRFKQKFTGATTNAFTITENSGAIPASKDLYIITVDGREIENNNFSISGSDVTLSFTVFSDQVVIITFYVI